MNCAQALAIAAATFVASGDAWTEPLDKANEELAAIAVRGHALGETALSVITAGVLNPAWRRCKGDAAARTDYASSSTSQYR